MICSSLNLDRLIVRLLLRDGLYLGLEGNQGLRSLLLAAALALVALQAGLLAGRGPAGMADTAMLGFVLESPWGGSTALRAAGAVALIAALAGPPGWRVAAGVAGAGAVAWSFASVGHTSDGHWLLPAALVLHLLAVLFWAGSLWPLARAARDLPPAEAAAAAERFGRVAMAAVGVLAVAGVVMAALLLGSVGALLGTAYGLTLGLKVLLVAGVLALAARHKLALVPGLAAADPGAGPRLARSIRLEAGLMEAVFLATAVLTTSTTPP
jgi:putative copper export protein